MGTLFDYIEWRGDLTFSQVPINDVDSLIFSVLSYLEFAGIAEEAFDSEPVSIQGMAAAFFAKFPTVKEVPIWSFYAKQICKLLNAVKNCKRFRNVGVKAYVNRIDTELETQFSAVTFLLDSGDSVVAFRGTDDSIIGWKENFNMSFMDVVPSQALACAYLNEAAQHLPGKIYLTGHSKGGNLAVYSAIHCEKEAKDRIAAVWCNDGPGFRREWLRDPAYLEVKSRIRTLLPQSSMVGILLEHEEDYIVVKSRQVGILQHDGVSWEVQGSSFVRVRDVSDDSKRMGLTLKNWIEELPSEQREQFCDALYQVLTADKAATIPDLMSIKDRWLIKGIKMDPEVWEVFKKTIQALMSARSKAKKELAESKMKK